MADWYIPPLRPLFPSALWKGPHPHIYLTFDDGPHDTATPRVLEALRAANVKATFFLTGEHVGAYPDLTKKIHEDGHTIGSHSYSHQALWFRKRSEVREELERCQRVIGEAVGETPVYFRPPYGRVDPRIPGIARSVGLQTVLWSVNSWDYDPRVDPVSIVNMVVGRTRPGDIVLFHENSKSAPRIGGYLASAIEGLRAKGYTFSALP